MYRSIILEPGTILDIDKLDIKDIQIKVRDPLNRYRTVSLFKELNKTKKYISYYNLGDYDTPPFLSMKRIYLSTNDISEYTQAMILLGSYEHWLTLTELSWFKPYVEAWRAELRTKLKSEQLLNLRTRANAGEVPAQRAMLDKLDPKPGRGRPSNRRQLNAASTDDLDTDYARIIEKDD